jgi:hypothetical protein
MKPVIRSRIPLTLPMMSRARFSPISRLADGGKRL